MSAARRPDFAALRGVSALTVASLLALAGLLALGPAAAQSEASYPEFLVVHEVDATQEPVELTVMTGDYDVDPGDVTLTSEGDAVTPTLVSSAIAQGDPVELAIVVDANNRFLRANAFADLTAQLASMVENLPPEVSVSVVSAGARERLDQPMTPDHAAAARALRELDTSDGSAIFNGISRASLQFVDPAAHRTILVVSAFADDISVVEPVEVRADVVQANAQLVTVRFQGDAGGPVGERRIDALSSQNGGITLQTTERERLAEAIDLASSISSDRLIVGYQGATDVTQRGDLTIAIGDTQSSISYPGGKLTSSPLSLLPAPVEESGPLDFFSTSTGLIITTVIAGVGVLAAVWALGNIFAGGETTLDSMLRRYSGEEEGDELDEEEHAIIQTALVKRAVELTESFAEDRGFLSRVEDLLEQAHVPLRAGEAMGIFGLGTVAGFVIGMLFTEGSIIRGLFVAGLVAFALIGGLQFKARKRVKAFEAQLPDMLQLLAGTLRAGYSLPQGLEAVSHEIAEPMGYELTRAMTEARLGREIEEALEGIAERLSSPDFAWAVMAISIQREVGGNLNELLMTVADTMVARERLAGEVRALTAEGKLSAFILGGLPPGLGFVMWLMNPDYINTLFTSGLGQGFIVAGVISGGIGLAWMKKVITINV